MIIQFLLIIQNSGYICVVNKLLDNPVYNALISGDAQKAFGPGPVKYFDQEVSPFVGFPEQYADGFKDLHHLLPAGRNILYATRNEITLPGGWELIHFIQGTQFIFSSTKRFENAFPGVTLLDQQHVDQMISLAVLTRPGPFGKRTIDFGHYHGIFNQHKLVSMTGRRLHVHDYTEVSAVCTHPDYLGRGYAQILLQHQINSILDENKIPFLHVRSDNNRAIDLYERLGFKKNGIMNFYFLQKID